MKYMFVNPQNETVSIIDCAGMKEAIETCNLEYLQTDHGTIEYGWGIQVYEFGLLEPAEHYFAIDKQLYAGNAVIYQYNDEGETIDVDEAKQFQIIFMHGINHVEYCIEMGLVRRPYTSVNGIKLAEWHRGELLSVPDKLME